MLWNRNFIQCCISYFLMFFAFYMLMPTMPVYLVEELHIDPSMVGLALSSYTIGLLCVRPFSGYLVDTFSRKPLYLISFLMFSLAFTGYWFAATVASIMAVRYIQGGFMGLASVSGNTITIDVIPSERRGEGIGFYGLTLNLAMSLSPLAAIAIYNYSGFHVMTGASLAIALVGFVAATLIHTPKKEKIASPPLSLDRFILVKGLPFVPSYLFCAVPYGMVISFVVLYGKEINVTNPGYFFIFFAIGVGISRFISGRLIDRGRLHAVVIVSLVTLILSLAAFSLFHYAANFFVMALIIGVGFGTSIPAFQCLFVNIAPNNMRGTATSTCLTSFDLGSGTGMLLAGFIASHVNLAMAFLAGAGCCLLSLLSYLLMAKPCYEKHRLI